MFTGLVSDVGRILSIEDRGELKRIRIETSYDPAGIAMGASIACSGPCLTAVAFGTDNGHHWFEVDAAAETLASEFGVSADVFSVTSWSELARDGMACERAARLAHATQPAHVHRLLAQHGSCAPIIAVSDYVRAVPDSIRAWLPAGRSYTTLGTDGFGRSDTRAALRDFFGVDAASVVKAALAALKLA
jgi:pyruvate dehydrogenase complex dehydrogenase (E1) component